MSYKKNIKPVILIFVATLSLLIFSFDLSAQQRFFEIDEFETTSGDTIYNCIIGYRTFGKLNSDSSNVIIYPTWFGGTSEHLQALIKPERFVDTTKYFVVAIDAFGNGISSSPSNYNGAKVFPPITISDMVKSQYRLLAEHFKFRNIYGAIGGSMGGMQIFEWVAAYPHFIDKAIAYVSTPQPTPNDLLQWNLRLEIIDNYRSLNAPDEQIQKTLNMLSELIARSPEYLNEKISFDGFDEYIQKFNGDPSKTFTIDNYRCQIEAMLSHNIYRGDRVETKPWQSTKMMLIVSATDRLVHAKNSIQFAEKYSCELHVLTNNCGHLAIGCEIDLCSNLIKKFFN